MEFIDSKANEEKKAWALIEQGYDAVFTGEAYGSVFFQNANHSRARDGRVHARRRGGRRLDDARRSRRASRWATYKARDIFRKMAEAAWICGDPGIQYDTTINDWHTSRTRSASTPANPCSEYMFLNDTACNLASLNLMKFVKDDGEFDVEAYRYAARLTITAQEILVDNASYPTPQIERELAPVPPARPGLRQPGRAADEPRPGLRLGRGPRVRGRAHRDHDRPRRTPVSGASPATTAARSTEYAKNEQPFLRVMGKHRDAAYAIPDWRSAAGSASTRHGHLGRGARTGQAVRVSATPR